MAVMVDVYVKTDEVVPSPIAGVLVTAFDPAASYAVAGGATTDSTGKASFLLPGSSLGMAYELRFFKLGVIVAQPVAISVQEPVVTTNTFDVSATLTALPYATDPSLCRCTGRFVDISNRPLGGVPVRISPITESGFQSPKVLNSNMVTGQVRLLTTDQHGYVSVDLIRGGEFYITYAGEDEVVWNFTVPDRASANLVELIHPIPASYTWASNTVTVPTGQTLDVSLSAVFTNFQTVSEGLSKWLLLNSSNEAVALVSFIGDTIVVAGVAPGTAQVTPVPVPNAQPIVVPTRTLSGTPLTVTVT